MHYYINSSHKYMELFHLGKSMRYIEFSKSISEARKNPEKNPKKSIQALLTDEFENSDEISGTGVTNLFVSFTHIEKLGLNPQSKYNTPIGIYSYPVEYVLDEMDYNSATDTLNVGVDADVLPFAGDAQYATTFSVKSEYEGTIVIFGEDEGLLNDYAPKLAKYVRTTYPRIYSRPLDDQIHPNDFESDEEYEYELMKLRDSYDVADDYDYDIDDVVTDVYNHLESLTKFNNKEYGEFWTLFYYVANKLAHRLKTNPAVVWTRLMLGCGINGVIDLGHGIIHENEPYQAVFFSRKFIDVHERYYNKYSSKKLSQGIQRGKENIKRREELTDIAKRLVDVYQNGFIPADDAMWIMFTHGIHHSNKLLKFVIKHFRPNDLPIVMRRILKYWVDGGTTPSLDRIESSYRVIAMIPNSGKILSLTISNPEWDADKLARLLDSIRVGFDGHGVNAYAQIIMDEFKRKFDELPQNHQRNVELVYPEVVKMAFGDQIENT